jgi:penicillin-binding protein 1C
MKRWRRRARIGCLCAAASLAAAYLALSAGLPSPDALLARASSPATRILDRNGRLLYEIIDPRSGSRARLSLDDIPPYCRQATIATEDAGFYTNSGIEPGAVLRAILQNAQAGEIVSGGSTITQQVARLLLLSPDERSQRSLTRKAREAILAVRIAQQYGKDDILALYLNEVYYGNLAYGLEAAAQSYFGVSARDLDLAQCALLAGLPQMPARLNPLFDPDAARARQRLVLGLMTEQGYITPAQADQAATESLRFRSAGRLLAPHFVAYVRNQIEAELGTEALLSGGWVITTTLDLDLQREAEAAVTRRLADLREHDVANAAVVVLDPTTGEILAMVGSADYGDAAIDGAFNAVLALRQPGSAMKPILYALAFERGGSPGDVVYDVPTAFVDESGETYLPANYDNLFHGPVSLRRALANSFNLPAVILQKRVGTADFLELARVLGLTTLTDAKRYGLTLTLGGGEVRLLDLTAAYGALANGGYAVSPCAIVGVSRFTHRVSLCPQSSIRNPESAIIDPRAVYMVTDILSDNDARAEQFGVFSPLRLPFPAAAKTGTTTQWRDNWTMGYTPQRVVGVWVGNADGHPMSHISGVDGAGPIWHDVMMAAHDRLPPTLFVEPPGIERREVCVTNGLAPGVDCPYRRMELYLAESPARPVETEYARVDGPIVWRAPTELRDWARENGVAFVVEADSRQEARGEGQEGRGSCSLPPASCILITSPAPGTHARIDPHLPIDTQQIEVSALVGDEAHVERVEFLIDGRVWASLSAPPYRAWWTLAVGEHRLSAVATDRQGRRWSSDAVTMTVEKD